MSRSYDGAGTYTIIFSVTESCGAADSDSTGVEIAEPDSCAGNSPPNALGSGPASAGAGQSLSFSAAGSSDSDNNIDTYEWDFGDGATASGEYVSHSSDEAGTYTVTLAVTDECGTTDPDTLNISVIDAGSGEITAEFIYLPEDSRARAPVTSQFSHAPRMAVSLGCQQRSRSSSDRRECLQPRSGQRRCRVLL